MPARLYCCPEAKIEISFANHMQRDTRLTHLKYESVYSTVILP